MSEADALAAIQLHIPARHSTNATVIAKSLLKKAVLKVGRTPSVHWNRTEVTFDLTSGQSRYELGHEILADIKTLKNVQYLWCTDTPGDPVPIVSVNEFNAYARGSSASSRPQIATLHSKEKILEVWPSPNSDYAMWGYAQNRITNFKDIPDEYHDVVIDYAVASMRAENALTMAAGGLEDAKGDAQAQWDGSTIPISRHVGRTSGRARADSHNLRGD
jgi:hypothetical protein